MKNEMLKIVIEWDPAEPLDYNSINVMMTVSYPGEPMHSQRDIERMAAHLYVKILELRAQALGKGAAEPKGDE